MSNDNKITLDLSSSLSGQHIDISQTLQRDSLSQVKKLLHSFQFLANEYEKKDKSKQSFDLMRSNNTIFIHGERGGGKTTFLRSILDEYKSKNSNGKFIALPLIDPTLVETNQHVLIDIVAKFNQLINDSTTCCKDEDKYFQYREHLEKMAEGLKLLYPNNQTQQYDAAYFLNTAINKSSSGQSLERHFHQFIDSMVSILNCDLFIIAIDDVDTKTDKANEILEVIRCYLTHPKLVILISGDLKLYSHIVRNNKIEEISADKKLTSDVTLVSHLEQQYLQKILPIEQRIALKNLDDITKRNRIIIKYNSNNRSYDIEETEIKELLEDILLSSLYINKQNLTSHIRFLMNQPIRTVFQLIKSMVENEYSEEDPLLIYPQKFKEKLYHSFIGSLVEEKIQLDNILHTEPHINSICLELFNLLYRHGELETGYYARPDSNHDQLGYNAAKLYLSSTISNVFSTKNKNLSNLNINNGNKNISNALKFMLAGGAASNIYLTYVDGNLKENHDFNHYLDYIGLSRNERISSLAAHFSPIILDQYDISRGKAIKSGVIRTPRRKPSSFDENNFLNAINNNKNINNSRIPSLESLANRHDDWNFIDYTAAKAILISSHYAVTTIENRDYISVYGLLASIAELLDETSNYTIESLTPVQTYIYPTFLSGKITGDKDSDVDIEINSNDDDKKTNIASKDNAIKLEEIIKEWKKIPLNVEVSSILIGKIWARLNYTLNQISEKSLEKQHNDEVKHDILLNELFSRYIWGTINAVLIEEFRYNKNMDTEKVNILSGAKNTNTTPDYLIRSMKILLENNINFKTTLPITLKLITCPLIWPFINYKSKRSFRNSSRLKLTIQKIIEKETEIAIETDGKIESEINNCNNILDYFIDTNHLQDIKNLKITALPIMGCFKS